MTRPYAIAHDFPPDPGDWLLNPLPLALLCFGMSALAARFARRRFEWVGAAVALACGLAVIALLQDETERLVDTARTYWVWLIAVTLSGVGGLFGLFAAALLTRVWSMTRDTCGMQRETFAWRVFAVKNVASPQEAVDTLKESGLEARHVAGGVDDYRLEIDEPQSICNRFSRRTIIARYPGAD